MPDSERERRVEQARKRWNEMSESKRSEICSAAIRAIRLAGKEGSKLEKFLANALRKEGHRVDFHKKDLIPTQKLEIDMYMPHLKTIIEIDGPSHFLPIWGEDKLAKQIKADAQKSGIILSKGYVIIRVKNLADFISLRIKDKLFREIKLQLDEIGKNFPKPSERFIEIEL